MPQFCLGKLIFNIYYLPSKSSKKSSFVNKSSLLLSFSCLIMAFFVLGLIIGGFSILQINSTLPDANTIREIELKIPLRVYSSDNLLISEFGDERRNPITIEETPQILIDAILASEDDAFYSHYGIDIRGLIRAAISNFQSGESGQGASTITMQVARNFFLTPEKTYIRKIREILVALRLEQILSKDEILSLYINKIFLGHRAYGFGAAAEVYYGKTLSELTISEASVLAGLPKAPSTSNPLRNPTGALQRRNYVLGRLQELGKITNDEYSNALAEPNTAEQHSRGVELSAPHIAEMVRAELIETMGEEAYWAGLNVYTTIESTQQLAAQDSLRNGLKTYDQRHGFRGPIKQVNLESLNNELTDSEIQSLEGSGLSQTELAYSEILSEIPNSQEQIPALVLNSTTRASELFTNQYGMISLSLESSAWAKRYKTANLIGDAPKSMQEILRTGDIVYVEPSAYEIIEGETPEESKKEPTEWRLSQIPSLSGSLISMDPANGRIISLVGGYDFFLNKYNRAVQSLRQPGSNIKPFIYAASLEHGYTPTSLISGAPIVIRDESSGTVWRPENYSGEFFGPTRMRTALAKSMNLVSIRLLRSIGIDFAREYASRFGIDMSRFSPTLTMALGSGAITPLEMLTAYSAIANSGYKIQPYFIDYITDKNGEIIYQAKQPKYCDECYADYLEQYRQETLGLDALIEIDITNLPNKLLPDATIASLYPEDESEYIAPRVMSHANNFMMVNMLKDVVKAGTARKALALNRDDLAGKTGTTNDYVDAWFSGFNSKVATTVWVGFDDPETMGRGEAGSSAALPIWVDYMATGLEDIAEDEALVPQYIDVGFVNRETGLRTDESDPNAMKEYFVINELTPETIRDEPFGGLQEIVLEDVVDFEDRIPQAIIPDQQSQIRIIDSAHETQGLF